MGTNVIANDISIDSNGNVATGTSSSGNLEVTGASAEKALVGLASGTGGIGIYGENTTYGNFGLLGGFYDTFDVGIYGYSASGYAGYFQGNTRITGNLTIDGTLIGPSIGDITEVNTGPGLTGGSTNGSINLNVDTSFLQRRVSISCTEGSSIRAINEDGTVLCNEVITYENGNVGIGTSSPSTELEVSGSIKTSEGVWGYDPATRSLNFENYPGEIVIEDFQNFNPVWELGPGCSYDDDTDTGDYIIGTKSGLFQGLDASNCAIGDGQISRITGHPVNIEDFYLRVIFKLGDYSAQQNASELVFVLSTVPIDGGGSCAYSDCSVGFSLTSSLWENQNSDAGNRDNVWQSLLLPIESGTNLLDRSKIDYWWLANFMTTGNTLHVNRLSLVPKPRKGAVALTFDNNYASRYKAAQYMALYDYSGTIWATVDTVHMDLTDGGETIDLISLAQLKQMQNLMDWSIGLHSYNHEQINQLTDDEFEENVIKQKKYWAENGLTRGNDMFAYPAGSTDTTKLHILRRYFKLARSYKGTVETIPFSEPYQLRTLNVDDGVAFSEVTNWIDYAMENKVLLILSFHNLPTNTECAARNSGGGTCPDAPSRLEYCFDSDCATNYGADDDRYFTNIVDYLNTNNVNVVNLADIEPYTPPQDNEMRTATTTIQYEVLRNLNNDPVQVVMPKGANTIVEFVDATLVFDATSTVYTGIDATEDLVFEYAASGTDVSTTIETDGFLTSNNDGIRRVTAISGDIDYLADINSGIQLCLTNGNITDGTGTLKVILNYRVHRTEL